MEFRRNHGQIAWIAANIHSRVALRFGGRTSGVSIALEIFCVVTAKNRFRKAAAKQNQGEGERGVLPAEASQKVYTQFGECFKDFIFCKKLLLLALIAHHVHRKR